MKTFGFGRRACLAIGGGVFCFGLAGPIDRTRPGVSFDFPGGRLEIGRVGTGSWWPTALAQSAETVSLETIRIQLEGSTISIPRLELQGTRLSGADLSALLDPKAGEPWAARLGRFSAGAIKAPEITVEQRAGSLRQTATYRDVLAENVVQGRFARVTAAGATIETSGPDDRTQSGRIGRLVAQDLDLTEFARIASEPAGADDSPLRTIQGAFSAEALAVQGSDGSRLDIGRLEVRDIRAKPARESWGATLETLAPQNWTRDPERARALTAAANLADALAIGSVEVSGIVIGSAGDNPVSLRIARTAYSGAADGRGAEARVEGLDLAGQDARTEIASLALGGLSWEPTIGGLRALAGKPAGPLDRADVRRLAPRAETLRAGGLALDAPDPRATPPGSRRTKLAVREVEFAADRPFDGQPTNVRFGITGFTVPIPADAPPESLKPLADMGYRALDVSFAGSTLWDPATSELAFRELSVSGQGMGRTSLTGVLGRVGKEAFDADPAVSLVALLGATAKTVRLTVSNEGLVERIVVDQAAKRGKSPDELRRDLGSMAAVGIPPMLGNSPGAQAIGLALARFIAKPGKLTISARAKDAGGLGIADISALGDAPSLLEKLEVTATAE
jgi:hypothetical protein